MSLYLPMSRFADIKETVTVSRPRSDWSVQVRDATQINPGKSETGFLASTSVPHIKTIWFLPMRPGVALSRGDRITDRFNRDWIIVEPIQYDRFDTWRCRSIHETLAPGPNDAADLLDAGQMLVARSIDAILYNRDQSVKRTETVSEDELTTVKTVEEKIVFQVKTAIDLTTVEYLRRKGENALYKVVACENAPVHSDWGRLTVQKIVSSNL